MHRSKWLGSLLNKLGVKSEVTTSEGKWKKESQKVELAFHVKDSFRQSEAFLEETRFLFESFGFESNQFKKNHIIDLGAGSKLRSKFFSAAKIIAIEPLAERFLEEIQWSDLNDAWKVYSRPAEYRIDELQKTADFVMSINVLDHCFDFPRIVDNIAFYLKSGGTAFLSFDTHSKPTQAHPLVLTEEVCSNHFKDSGFIIDNFSSGFPAEFTNFYPDRRGYGSKESISLNYWLRKP